MWKNSVNVAIGDVGMFLSTHVLKSLNSIKKTSPRIMVLHLMETPTH